MEDIKLLYVDLFCGAGGTTTGVELATLHGHKCAKVVACVNHDANAIASHKANHPETVHYTEDIRTLAMAPLSAVVDIPAEKVGVSEITVTRHYIHVLPTTDRPMKAYRATINDKLVQTRELARNDGFTRTQDFVDFIDPLFDKYQSETIRLAIIHFTDFRY